VVFNDDSRMSRNNIFVFIVIAAIVSTHLITAYLIGDRANKIESRYKEKVSRLDSLHTLKMDKIKLEKQGAVDSLTIIADQRLYTIEELKNRPNESNEKIRYIVRDYRNDELDSIIRVLFSDISRFN
jgi:hypothetical protein